MQKTEPKDRVLSVVGYELNPKGELYIRLESFLKLSNWCLLLIVRRVLFLLFDAGIRFNGNKQRFRVGPSFAENRTLKSIGWDLESWW